jgi:membrane-associated protein
VFTHDYRWLNKEALTRTHNFFEKHGGKTIVLARFIPVVRTFAPFVAGVSDMTFARFQLYNFTGAILWVLMLTSAGYFFGNIPIVREHLTEIVLFGVGLAIVPMAIGAVWKLTRRLQSR